MKKNISQCQINTIYSIINSIVNKWIVLDVQMHVFARVKEKLLMIED